MKQRRKTLWWVVGAVALLCLAAAIAGIAVLRSAWFRDRVRERLVSEVEHATGGRAEIGSFRFDWHGLTAEIAPFIIHGEEPAGSPPLFHADSIRVGLKIVSLLERNVDIQSLVAEKPELRILVNPDGSTNFPRPPAAHQRGDLVQQILKLAVRRLELNHGFIQYNSRRWPLDARAEDLKADVRYDRRGQRYRASVSMSPLRFSGGPVHDLTFGVTSALAIDKQGLRDIHGQLRSAGSNIRFDGEMLNWSSPAAAFSIGATVALTDVNRPFGLQRTLDRGTVAFNGRLLLSAEGLRLDGASSGRDIDVHTPEFRLRGGAFSAHAEITESGANLTGLTANALRGRFQGRLDIEKWKSFVADGEARGISVRELAAALSREGAAWEGTATGPVRASGELSERGFRDVIAQAEVDVSPAVAGPGVTGRLDINYDEQAGVIRLGQSWLTTGQSHISLEGTLGRSLNIGVDTHNIDDLLPLFRLAGTEPPQNVPVHLANGASGHLSATVNGPLENPTLTGQVTLGQFEYQKQTFDQGAATFDLTRSQLAAREISIAQGAMQLSGAGHAGLNDWHVDDASPVSGSFTLRNGDLAKLAAEAGKNWPVEGAVSGALKLDGTWGNPSIVADAHATKVTAWGEQVAKASVEARCAAGLIEVLRGEADAGGGHLSFTGAWRRSTVEFRIKGTKLSLGHVARLREMVGNAGGSAEVDAAGTARVDHDRIELETLRGSLAVTNVSVNGELLGGVTAGAETVDSTLKVSAEARLPDATLKAEGEWKLEGDYSGRAQLTASPISLATVDRAVTAVRGEPAHSLPFVGSVSGSATMTGPLADPNQLRGEVRLEQIRVAPNPAVQSRAGAAPPEITLTNAAPVIFDVSKTGADIREARFTAIDTELSARGRIGFGDRNPCDASVTGSINLRILRLFNSDLLASGHANARATIRGSLDNPQLSGRLELQNASLYLADLPNGVDKTNGVIVFDRNRATIQRLTAESGGGRVSFTGFVGFAGPVLTYRVAARAEAVRYRSSQGASITMDATLDLTGTSETSLASGNVTVVRAAFNPSTDIGSLLAQAAKPVATPPQPSEYFRGLRFDIHVDTAQHLDVQTSLARNLQGQADLHITGTPQHPVVLGNISVSEGSVEFFGNRYTINRGEVHFYNPLEIEPVVDLDLETHERGITVDIILNGPLDRLSLSYRSDPPLKSEQIVALLAVGRSPNAPGALASTQATGQTALLESGSNALLQQALTAPVTGRLERFFGVSHIRLDPQLTDITTVPQARLSVEQQISKDVTLTYTTNLARTQEQLVQIEWDLSRKWSVVAVRDENGFFGIDFQYRKRFK